MSANGETADMERLGLIRDICRLYAVTDSRWHGKENLAEDVKMAIAGGATFVQLREKDATTQQLVDAAKELAPICEDAGVPLVINDDIEAARLVGADGVHIGQADADCSEARALLGPDAIIGVSAQTVDQALKAQDSGADYLGVGAVFATGTKTDADSVSLDALREICESVSIPVVAIGGVDATRIPELEGTGIDGVAVVSALFASDDIEGSAKELDLALDRWIFDSSDTQ